MEVSDCSICLSPNDATSTSTKCRHLFHVQCLSGWLSIRHYCALCRQNVTEAELNRIISLNREKEIRGNEVDPQVQVLVEQHPIPQKLNKN